LAGHRILFVHRPRLKALSRLTVLWPAACSYPVVQHPMATGEVGVMLGRQVMCAIALLATSCLGAEPGLGDGTTPPGAGPSSLPEETWRFVPIPGMICANDTPTGIGMNLSRRSNKLYI